MLRKQTKKKRSGTKQQHDYYDGDDDFCRSEVGFRQETSSSLSLFCLLVSLFSRESPLVFFFLLSFCSCSFPFLVCFLLNCSSFLFSSLPLFFLVVSSSPFSCSLLFLPSFSLPLFFSLFSPLSPLFLLLFLVRVLFPFGFYPACCPLSSLSLLSASAPWLSCPHTFPSLSLFPSSLISSPPFSSCVMREPLPTHHDSLDGRILRPSQKSLSHEREQQSWRQMEVQKLTNKDPCQRLEGSEKEAAAVKGKAGRMNRYNDCRVTKSQRAPVSGKIG